MKHFGEGCTSKQRQESDSEHKAKAEPIPQQLTQSHTRRNGYNPKRMRWRPYFLNDEVESELDAVKREGQMSSPVPVQLHKDDRIRSLFDGCYNFFELLCVGSRKKGGYREADVQRFRLPNGLCPNEPSKALGASIAPHPVRPSVTLLFSPEALRGSCERALLAPQWACSTT